MSLMQSVPRSLLSQRKPAMITITRMFDDKARKKFELRKRRIEAKKNEDTPVECYKAWRRSENKCNQPRLLLLPECLEPCDLDPPPMDLDHYTPSDKKARKYQRTWCECYALPKKFVDIKKCYPNRPRRKLHAVATSSDCIEKANTKGMNRIKPEKLVQITCMKTGKIKCCKIPAPGCEPGREDPSCSQERKPTCCKKRCTKYPSFSECQPVGLLDPIAPCECEQKTNMCDMFAYLKHLEKRK